MSVAGEIGVYSRGERGHRRAYLDFVSKIFATERIPARVVPFLRKPMFFLMIEEGFSFFVIASLWRALLGQQTVGLLFRPMPAVHGIGFRLGIKRTLLKLMKKISSITVLTIVPFSIAPEFEMIADDWIFDLQLWDLSELGKDDLMPPHVRTLANEIMAAADGRQVVGALGHQDRNKGFDVFARTWIEGSQVNERFLFAYGGSVEPSLTPCAEAFVSKGGFALNRHISDDELFQIYAASDVVWCLYDKTYDQASGILGRAIQLGIPAIVRKGSLSHRLCVEYGAPHIAGEPHGLEEVLRQGVPPRSPRLGVDKAAQFKAVSIRKLALALNVEPQG